MTAPEDEGEILGMSGSRTGTAVDDTVAVAPAVDRHAARPRSVLTPMVRLTCDDARHPQFPHPLRRRRILPSRGTIVITAGDERRAA